MKPSEYRLTRVKSPLQYAKKPFFQCPHLDCKYRSGYGDYNYCDYIGNHDDNPEHHIRGCKADENCVRYIPGPPKQKTLKPIKLDNPLLPKVKKLHERGLSDKSIAEKLDLSRSTISKYRRELGLNPNPSKKGPSVPVDYERVRHLYDLGLYDNEIGEELGISATAVYHWRERNKLPSTFDKSKLSFGYDKKKRRRYVAFILKEDSEGR